MSQDLLDRPSISSHQRYEHRTSWLCKWFWFRFPIKISPSSLCQAGTKYIKVGLHTPMPNSAPHPPAAMDSPSSNQSMLRKGGPAILELSVDIPHDLAVSFQRVQYAWQAVSNIHPLLRARVKRQDARPGIFHQLEIDHLVQPVVQIAGSLSSCQGRHDSVTLYFNGQYSERPVITLRIPYVLSDRTSLVLVQRDFVKYLLSYREESLSVSYLDFISRQNSQIGEAYWANTLVHVSEAPLYSFPTEYEEQRSSTKPQIIDGEDFQSLTRTSQTYGISLAAVIYFASSVALAQHTQDTQGKGTFAVEGRNLSFPGSEMVVGHMDQTYLITYANCVFPDEAIITGMHAMAEQNHTASEHAFIGLQNIMRFVSKVPQIKDLHSQRNSKESMLHQSPKTTSFHCSLRFCTTTQI